MIGKVIGHMEENNGNGYLIFWFDRWKQRNIKKIQGTLEWDWK